MNGAGCLGFILIVVALILACMPAEEDSLEEDR